MSILLSKIGRYLAHKLVILTIILAVLLGLNWIRGEWVDLSRVEERIKSKENYQQELKQEVAELEASGIEGKKKWAAAQAQERERLESGLLEIETRIKENKSEWLAKLKELRDAATDTGFEVERSELQLERAEDAVPLGASLLPGYGDKEQGLLLIAETRLAAARRANSAAKVAQRAFERSGMNAPNEALKKELIAKQQEIDLLEGVISSEMRQLEQAIEGKEREMAATAQDVAALKKALEEDPFQKFLAGVKSELPRALAILLAIALSPLFLKLLMFYGVAPFVQRLKPVLIYPNKDANPIPEPERSSVSVPIAIGATEELLVHNDFLQRSSEKSLKRTQYFLNSRIPFSSIAAGMFGLTRIRPSDETGTEVVVSSQNDAFGELSLLEIPEGASMILQPRSLAGVLKGQSKPVKITRKWRLFSLHAWLTLQLRYLIFHGPCKVILKGCRGVRAEASESGKAKVINQSSTIGFSGNLNYRNTRCETFLPYLTGKEDLFNDCFEGSPGRFVYEEMPAGGRKGGIMGRGLEGALDACLKVFGI